MSEPNEADESFAQFAMELFAESGHTDILTPVFENHSPNRFVYFDNGSSVTLPRKQREKLKCFRNVSYLFSLGDEVFEQKSHQQIAFYSAELICPKSMRSQTAYDVHKLMRRLVGADATVILFKHDDSFLLSLTGYGQENVLSDWYSMNNDCDIFIEKLHIANESLQSAHDYFFDLAYNAAREYYTYPVSMETAAYTLFPVYYFLSTETDNEDREEIGNHIRDALNFYLYRYADDYVEPEQSQTPDENASDIGEELELLLFDIESEENGNHDDPFGEETNSDFDNNWYEAYKYEFNDVDPEIFKDPELMLKWIETIIKSEEESNDSEAFPP